MSQLVRGWRAYRMRATTFTAGLRLDGIFAPWLLDGAMDGEAFLTYLRKVLTPLSAGPNTGNNSPSSPRSNATTTISFGCFCWGRMWVE